MTAGQSTGQDSVAARDWPEYDLTPTFNPAFLPADVSVAPDEVVLYDPMDAGGDAGQWIAAARDSYVSLPDCR